MVIASLRLQILVLRQREGRKLWIELLCHSDVSNSEAESYRALAATVRDFLYVSVPVTVERLNPETHEVGLVHVNVTPMPWDGPGLLGCEIRQFLS
jgi:pyruvate-formate lyase-activating enzyme